MNWACVWFRKEPLRGQDWMRGRNRVYFDEHSNAVQYDANGSFCPGKNAGTERIPLTESVGTACLIRTGQIIAMVGAGWGLVGRGLGVGPGLALFGCDGTHNGGAGASRRQSVSADGLSGSSRPLRCLTRAQRSAGGPVLTGSARWAACRPPGQFDGRPAGEPGGYERAVFGACSSVLRWPRLLASAGSARHSFGGV